MRQVPNDEQGYDKDYGQENVNEESITQVAQQAQYAARLNGDDEDADVAPKKERKRQWKTHIGRHVRILIFQGPLRIREMLHPQCKVKARDKKKNPTKQWPTQLTRWAPITKTRTNHLTFSS
ncbi:unnamed protein product [Nesidiocoris tenuis]|uniref:Uncharacterized protein n=1 Tax=Nesidiocoris tenuis TaxID=355587 RepID=A0A6H5G0W8_9HEMI|nr:unnamed protein product [Nesidiocoris tenuis]